MYKHIAAFLLLLIASGGICQDAQRFYDSATAALENGKYPEYYSNIMKAYALHPYNQNILWQAGVAAALTDRPKQSIEFLIRAININAGFELDTSHLLSLQNNPDFEQLRKTKDQLNRPVIHSDTAFVITDRHIHLEAVAYDYKSQAIYGGSIHKRKIIRIEPNGLTSDFTTEGQHKMAAVFGLKVDAKRRLLWACSSPIPEMQNYDSAIPSSVFQFDLRSGHLLNTFYPADTLTNHIFGDLVLDSNGRPYISDSKNNIVYQIDIAHKKLFPFFTSTEFWNLQGLAFSDDDRLLYISDYIKGIYVLNTQNMQLKKVEASYDLSLKGTDGLTFFKNSLITLQNGVQPNRVVRHFLDESGSKLMHYELIDNAHPAFGEPTIGSLWENTFYYVANSQWNGYENGKIKPIEDLRPTVILKYLFKDDK